MRRTVDSIVRVVCLIVLGAVVASAQPGGRLTGVVRDATTGVLPGVAVTVSGAALIAPRTVVTDEHGEYVVEALPAGRYLVTAAFGGFEPSSVAIDMGATSATLNLVLAVSSLAERVTVTATKTGAADVQSTPMAITVLPARALEQMGVQTVEGLAGVVPAVTMSQHTGWRPGDHPRHRHEQHGGRRRSEFHHSSRRRLSRTARDGVCRFSRTSSASKSCADRRGRSTAVTRSAGRSTS